MILVTEGGYLMLANAGGTKRPKAKLKSQFPIDARPIPVARVSKDQISPA